MSAFQKTAATFAANMVVLMALCSFCDAQNNELSGLQNEFEQQIVPILQSKCSQCHSGDDANAGINFEAFETIQQILNADRKWSLVDHEITTQSMPPEDEPQLTEKESKRLTHWIHDVFKLINCESINPGNVTIRKLTRYEYRNSIRDLLGIDYRPAENFPGDDVGHGFDNIADVLSLPPILFERYLDAAEEVSRRAIFDPDKLALDIDLSATSFGIDRNQARKDDGKTVLFTEGSITKSIRFPEIGAYALAVRAYGDQAGKEDVKMSAYIDGKKIETQNVKSSRRKPGLYVFRLPIHSPGIKKISLSFDNDFYVPRSVASQDRNLHLMEVYIKGPKRNQPAKRYLRFPATDSASAANFVRELLPRAFRTRVQPQQVDRFMALYQQGIDSNLTFHESLQRVTQAILVSPQFLYRFEEPVSDGSIRSLTHHERATALSYFLWSSTPDDELLNLANDSRLSDPAIWRQQIERLIDDPRSQAIVENFATQWLNLRVLADTEPDPKLFPDVDKKLLRDMETETRMVVADIFTRDGSVLELLDCNFSFVNQPLARHYGMHEIQGNRFRKVSLGGNRTGVLTHASILTLTSNPTRTSPVKRGKWVMENILGEEPPPPLASITPLDDQTELTGSLRQRMQQHRTNPACASCHVKMDALGFALENYDAVGRFRLEDDGFEIDATSEMPGGIPLDGATGLQKQLQTTYKDQFIRCFTEKLLVYALGRGLQYYDRCTVKQIIKQAAANDYHISEFIIAIANSDTFLKRSGKPSLSAGESK